jgi:hypothetical protein
MRTYINTTIILSAFIVFASGCKKDPDEVIILDEEVVENIMKLHVEHAWGDEDFEYGDTYSSNGVDVKFDTFKFFMSDFMLHDDDENMQMMPNKVLLIDAETHTADLGAIDFDHIHEMRFTLGLSETLNESDPTVADAPLNDFGMHWSWASGYKFIRIDGQRDHDGDGEFDAFSIHVGSDELARNIWLDVHQDVIDGELEAHVHVDYMEFLSTVDLSVDTLQGTHAASDLTTAIADAAQSSGFEIE